MRTLSPPASAPRSSRLGGTGRRCGTSQKSRERWKGSSATSRARFSRASECCRSAATAHSWLTRQLAQIVPAIEAGVVSVVEHDLDCVIANRLDRDDGDILLARDKLFLARRMPLHFGARALDAQPLGGQSDRLAVIEGDLKDAPLVHRRNIAWPGHRGFLHSRMRMRGAGFAPGAPAASVSATRRAISSKALACGLSAMLAMTGRPSSELARIAMSSGTSPRKGTPSFSASLRAPPCEKTSVRPPQCAQTKEDKF